MNEQVNWDQTLIKKYSSSNHFKLLNQLRNEIKKYPLNKKKNSLLNPNNQRKPDNKYISNKVINPDIHGSSVANNNTEVNAPKSTISFNNSKNFSIYNNKINDLTTEHEENKLLDEKKKKAEAPPQSFNDRLNQIELK